MQEQITITMTGLDLPDDWKEQISQGEAARGAIQCEVRHTVWENTRKWERTSTENFPERAPIGWCWQHVVEKAKEQRLAWLAE